MVEKSLTVSELIELLKKQPQELLVSVLVEAGPEGRFQDGITGVFGIEDKKVLLATTGL
jgi:hypothetical protein